MKLSQILASQSIWLFQPSEPDNDNVRTLNLIRAFESRYAFLQGPRILADYDISKGITFLHGQYKRRFTIDKFMVFANGILAEAKVPTEECDEFLRDVREWAHQEFGFTPTLDTPIARSYLSQLEVQSDVGFGKSFKKFSAFGKEIADILISYGQSPTDFGVSSLAFHCDVVAMPLPKPLAFRFERRDAQPHSSNLFFSMAPLQTADHLRCVTTLEKILSS